MNNLTSAGSGKLRVSPFIMARRVRGDSNESWLPRYDIMWQGTSILSNTRFVQKVTARGNLVPSSKAHEK